jgi:small ligand-binding sensory domain FIST
MEVRQRLLAQRFDPGAGGTALVFASSHLASDAAGLSRALEDALGAMPFVGFVGRSAFHDVRLRERRPGLSVLVLEGARGRTHVDDPSSGRAARLFPGLGAGRARFLAIGSDASPDDVRAITAELDAERVPFCGAVNVPAATGPGPPLTAGGGRHAAAVLDVDDLAIVPGVTQAARPLGQPRVVTAAHGNVIEELDGKPALEALRHDLPSALKDRAQALGAALHVGIRTDDGEAYLMRTIVGLDPAAGTVSIADEPRAGVEVVFALRDAAAARADLDDMLLVLAEALGPRRPLAIVVFAGLARDEGLFGVPCHDVQRVLSRFGTEIPVVGLAGSSEICTYGEKSHVFGTACVVAALLRG